MPGLTQPIPSAIVAGSVASLGDAYNIEIGICYGTHINPTIYSKVVKADTIRIGNYKCQLTNLNPGTIYHAKAYVAWGVDVFLGIPWIIYGDEITFTTKDL